MRVKLDSVIGVIFGLIVAVAAVTGPHEIYDLSTCDVSTIYITIPPTSCEAVSISTLFSYSTVYITSAPPPTVTIFLAGSTNNINSPSSYEVDNGGSSAKPSTITTSILSTTTVLEFVTYTNYASESSLDGAMNSRQLTTTVTYVSTLFVTQTEFVATSTMTSSSSSIGINGEPVVIVTAITTDFITIPEDYITSSLSTAPDNTISSPNVVLATETLTVVPLPTIPVDTSHVSIFPHPIPATPTSPFSKSTGAGSLGWNYTASPNSPAGSSPGASFATGVGMTTASGILWPSSSLASGISVTSVSGITWRGASSGSGMSSHRPVSRISVSFNHSRSLDRPTTAATFGSATSSADPPSLTLLSHKTIEPPTTVSPHISNTVAASKTTYASYTFNTTVSSTSTLGPYKYKTTASSTSRFGPYSYDTSSISTGSSFAISTSHTAISKFSIITTFNSILSTGNNTTPFTSSAPKSVSTPLPSGPKGEFVLNFDNIPPLAASNDTITSEPIFSPYQGFYFSRGFFVVPPPTDPYRPSSPPLLLEFVPGPANNDTVPTTNATSTDIGISGDIGIGSEINYGCFSFNFLAASLGCDSLGADCDWQFTGSRRNYTTGMSQEVATQYTSTPACPGLTSSSCDLVLVLLEERFENLTSIRINVTVAGVPKIWWLDDLRFGWYEDNCEGEACRAEALA